MIPHSRYTLLTALPKLLPTPFPLLRNPGNQKKKLATPEDYQQSKHLLIPFKKYYIYIIELSKPPITTLTNTVYSTRNSLAQLTYFHIT